jgi:uncharacterized membrane protein
MKEIIEWTGAALSFTGELTELVLNGISLLFIMLGLAMSLVKSFRNRNRLRKVYPLHLFFRMKFGGWLVVALEFQLAADIVGTIIAPGNRQLIELGVIAVIRTFLNYFLSRELNEELELTHRIAAGEENKIQ